MLNSESSNLPILLAIDELTKVENAINDLRPYFSMRAGMLAFFQLCVKDAISINQTHNVPLEKKSKETIYSQWANLRLARLVHVVLIFDDALLPKFERTRD